jgi:hypothetical protein
LGYALDIDRIGNERTIKLGWALRRGAAKNKPSLAEMDKWVSNFSDRMEERTG